MTRWFFQSLHTRRYPAHASHVTPGARLQQVCTREWAHARAHLQPSALFLPLFFCALALLGTLAAAPCPAWAKYTDVSSQYPASRDLSETASEGLAAQGKSIYPAVVQAADIQDGTYIVPAYTSSRMCNLYTSAADAAAKTNPNQVVLTVSGNTITATFYMSGAYNALYFGTADQAAALAPADGVTPSSSYLVDTEGTYDTGHGPFTVQLSSLNTEFTFAVYNGGTKGIEGGAWYTRLGSVIATTDFAEAYILGGNVNPTPDDPGSDDTGGGSGSNGSGSEQPSEASGAGTGSGAGAGAGAGSAAQTNEQTNDAAQNASSSDQSESDTTASTEMHGKLITVVNANNAAGGSEQTVLSGQMVQLAGLSTQQIAALLGTAALLAGIVFMAVRFRMQLRNKASEWAQKL